MPQDHLDPRRELLDTLETKVSDLLEEACRTKIKPEGTTGEFIRLEETLSIAAETTKHVVSLRRKLRTEQEARRDAEAGGPPLPA